MTFKNMCEEILHYWNETGRHRMVRKDGNPLTAENIFNYSATGELFMLWEWYEEAKWWTKLKEHEVASKL